MPHALRSRSVLVVLLAACASPGGIPPTAPPDLGRRVVAEHFLKMRKPTAEIRTYVRREFETGRLDAYVHTGIIPYRPIG